jgi:hypothetical protein
LSDRSLHLSAHAEVVAAGEVGRFDGVMMSVRALRAKAADERRHGRAGGAYDVSADYLERSLQATIEGPA